MAAALDCGSFRDHCGWRLSIRSRSNQMVSPQDRVCGFDEDIGAEIVSETCSDSTNARIACGDVSTTSRRPDVSAHSRNFGSKVRRLRWR
jgi:hypothetical protein